MFVSAVCSLCVTHFLDLVIRVCVCVCVACECLFHTFRPHLPAAGDCSGSEEMCAEVSTQREFQKAESDEKDKEGAHTWA